MKKNIEEETEEEEVSEEDTETEEENGVKMDGDINLYLFDPKTAAIIKFGIIGICLIFLVYWFFNGQLSKLNISFDFSLVTIIIPILMILYLLYLTVKTVRPTELGIIEKFGKFNRIAEPGLAIIIPVIEKIIYVPTTEMRVDVEKQEVITKDNLNATVDAVVYYKIKDTKKALYGIQDYASAVPSLAQTTLRAVIGKMNLSEANVNRKQINIEIMEELDKQTNDWGIDIIRVELQSIQPPSDVQENMNKVVKAENDKISAINFANAVETEADGKKRALIKEAEGKAKSIELTAQAQAEAIKLVNQSAEKYFIGNAKELKKLEVTQQSLSNNTKYVIPEGVNISTIISDIAGVTPIKEDKNIYPNKKIKE